MSDLLVKPKNEKLIVILGATATGKSRFSVDLATHISPSEIINSDKMHFYRGLDITANKIALEERRGIPHHLIDDYDSADGDLPILIGGSNSYIHAFLAKHFDSDSEGLDFEFVVSSELRYNCCFLWVYVAPSIHKQYIYLRVQQMLDAGMLEELSEYFEKGMDTYSPAIKKLIGVNAFKTYFNVFPPGNTNGKTSAIKKCIGSNVDMKPNGKYQESDDATLKKTLLEEAIQTMKLNAYELAKRQVEKINFFRSSGWNILKLDATEAIRTVLAADPDSANSSKIIWEKEIVEPSMKVVQRFLEE
ncbi:hypothetical protein MKW98_001413 [Papaver atlanticum]|uniref:Uncharacterized protein n=1 Tax=Papaver atlanticum TaxID=357466 RepID=A0AAD4XQP6_9MAGN|nr:hypothetical protein MKW98_001413 [Papaver atlanticum]